MKSIAFKCLMLIFAVAVCLCVLAGCSADPDDTDTEPEQTDPRGDDIIEQTECDLNGHTWVEATCVAARTCSVCDATEGEALGHTWVEAKCDTARTCSVCGATEGEALGHTWVEATCETARTCSVCGATDGEALGHTWVEATCETARTCSVCGATEGEALGHNFADGICTLCGTADPNEEQGELYFVLDEDTDTYIVFGNNIVSSDIVIPSEYNGKAVTSIGSFAFSGCTGLTSITIPDSVTSIDFEAFHNCSGLTSIVVPNSVTSIGGGAFTGCTGLTSITIPFVGAASDGSGSTKFEYIFEAYFSEPDDDQDDGVPSSLRTVVITGGTNIDRWAFSNCSNITSITISGVEKICHEAFRGCSGLTSVVIGDGVTSIESGVFSECSSLTNITIPDSITSIDGELFRDCSSLEYNTYEGGRYLGCEDNPYLILVSATDKNITSCKIHEKTRFVCGAAFYDCYSLEAVHITDLAAWLRIKFSDAYANPLEYAHDLYLNGEKISGDVVIPDGVTDIPAATFMNCTGLTSINIPNGMTSISAHSFSECTSLTSVTIPEGVVNIDGNAFSYCSALTSVTIPASVTSIDYDSFYGCKDIEGMSVSKGNSVYHSAGNCLIETATKTIIIGFNNSFIPMDGSVTNISDNAFSGCSRLVEITIPESVTNIGYGAFENCENLLVIKNKSDLELSIGSTDNGNVAYSAYLIIDKQGNKTYREGYIYTDGGFVYEKEGESYRLVAYTGGEYMVTLPSKLVLDGAEYDYEIYKIRGVRDVTIPVGATKIDDYAFYECESLKSVYISDGVTSIGWRAFFGCSGLNGIAIPESVTDIGGQAFYNCSSLMDIIIPSGVENMGYEAFHGCTKLDFSVYDNAKYLGNQSNPYFVLIEATGADITSCQIHADTKVIASDAFSDCSNLTSITVPDSVTSICYGAFMGCSGLESITIPFVGATSDGTNSTSFSWIFGVDRNIELPSGLKSVVITGGASIDENAFNSCENLTSITISDSVTSIGWNAFIWCSGLTDISYLGTKEQWSGISKGADWNFSTGDYTVHCSDGDLTKAES